MTLDNPEQRALLLQIMDAINVPGKDIETVYALKQAILNAMYTPPPQQSE